MSMTEETPAAEVLEKLFTSGDWSDLKIASPTKTFDVHKSIVCSACPFFEAACKNSWQEAQSGIIDVPEPEIIVNALIRYMYGMHNVSGIYDEQPSYTDDIKCVYQLGVAADKYGLTGLHTLCTKHIITRYRTMIEPNNEEVLGVALWFYEPAQRPHTSPAILRATVRRVARAVQWYIENDQESWDKLAGSPDLLRDVMYFCSRSAEEKDRFAGEYFLSDYLKDPRST